ncbi:MAG: iron ABC transporter substrate-binding protein [Spirochaetales bacterium]|nr:iron ABC transporter substrate-binding protein [Spirochaetales bacterium]
MKGMSILIIALAVLGALNCHAGGSGEAQSPTAQIAEREALVVVDALGREIRLPQSPERVICSGPGCLRLLTYLQAQGLAVAVDDMEGRRPMFDARPYALANPQFKELPLFGEFRGHDNPELIVALDPRPELIFKTFPSMGTDPMELERKTGIPVLTLEYGDLFGRKEDFHRALRTMAEVLGRSERAEEVIAYIDGAVADLQARTSGIPEGEKRSCYVGGIASRGPHGFQSTEPAYPPFLFVNAANVAYDPEKSPKELEHADMAKEQIVAWDPEVLFVDVSTIQADPQANAMYELRNDPAYRGLRAVKSGEVYGVLPYNWYTVNFGSILADAYFVGKVLYPERFADVDPAAKADEIYTFLVGGPVFQELNEAFQGLVFERIPLEIPG